MSRRALMTLAVLVVAAAAIGSLPGAAYAEFGPIELVSKSTTEQAAEAKETGISADGRYLVFVGMINGLQGIFRKDLSSGGIEPVVELSNQEAIRSAAPSISGDGRYVAFTTTLQLDPEDDIDPASSDVYVADMSMSPPTYELASALDDCDPATSAMPCGLSYVEESGSVAAGRVAISEDGRRVAFVVRSVSDLAGPGTPSRQVAVRDLAAHRTYLISVRTGTEEPVAGGGAASAPVGAAISGDGSTVAWVARQVEHQVPMLAAEAQAVEAFEGDHPAGIGNEYHEPLWRRVPSALEPDPATRRVVGGGDPLAPGCPAAGTFAELACQGPFPDLTAGRKRFGGPTESEGRGWGVGLPQLDRDGEMVAFVGNPDEDNDLFVVDMAAGLSRLQAVHRLTHWTDPLPGSNNETEVFAFKYKGLDGPIEECAISADGNRIAFTTARQVFPLAPPTLVSPRPPGISEAAELYQIDLAGQTIERATPGKSGGVSLGGNGATSPSYADEGRLLAFSSSAYNLVAGDTNGKSDAFVVESPPAAPIESTKISPRPVGLTLQPLWRMTVATSTLPDGRVRLVVGVPGSGSVRAKASARLGRRLRKRRVASVQKRASAAGAQTLILRLPGKLRYLAKRKGGLYAQLDIAFESPAGKPLSAGLDARFLVHRRTAKGRR